MNIVYKDFSVRSTAVEATAVWSQGQAFHATIVSGLHFKRNNCYICNRCFVKDEPQADDFVTATRSQQFPVVGELDCVDGYWVAQKFLTVEWRSEIRFFAVKWEALGSKIAMRIVTPVLLIACSFGCFCCPLDRFPSDTNFSDRLFSGSLKIFMMLTV